jgi:hypothetical protein
MIQRACVRAAAFSASSSASSCAGPMCSISRDPRRDDHTTCTAVAPDFVFTVRTYGTSQLYGPSLVRKSAVEKPGTRRSARRARHEPAIVSQLRPNMGRRSDAIRGKSPG